MANSNPPPAIAGGEVVAQAEPSLTGKRGPDTPDSMPRDQDAVDRAKAAYDARRANSKVRLAPEIKDFVDDLAKADKTTVSALVEGWLEADMKKRGGTWLKKFRAMLERKERDTHQRRVEGALNRDS